MPRRSLWRRVCVAPWQLFPLGGPHPCVHRRGRSHPLLSAPFVSDRRQPPLPPPLPRHHAPPPPRRAPKRPRRTTPTPTAAAARQPAPAARPSPGRPSPPRPRTRTRARATRTRASVSAPSTAPVRGAWRSPQAHSAAASGSPATSWRPANHSPPSRRRRERGDDEHAPPTPRARGPPRPRRRRAPRPAARGAARRERHSSHAANSAEREHRRPAQQPDVAVDPQRGQPRQPLEVVARASPRRSGGAPDADAAYGVRPP